MAIKTLVMGFGGTGTHVLTYLKELAIYKHGRRPDHLAFIEFDTIDRSIWRPGATIDVAGAGGASEVIAVGRGDERIALDPDTEYMPLEEGQPNLHALVHAEMTAAGNRERYPHLKDWLHTDWLSSIMPAAALNIANGAAQQRQIGRYAMFANIDRIVNQIRKVLGDLSRVDTSGGDLVNVWIVGSSAGGTGAGCIIDAAAIVRMVAESANLRPTIVGLIVLPDVYSDADGVSRARAYSFFRDLERFQEFGIPPSDRYVTGAQTPTASNDITYDVLKKNRAILPARLFDYLVYLGERCTGNQERKSFFNSVANAVDVFLDANVGPRMMEELVNLDGNPLCFGAARLSIPLNSLSELFAWEQVSDVLKAVGAPRREPDGFISGIEFGSPRDRQDAARQRVEEMLQLFKDLRELADQERERLPQYLDLQLEPETIIRRWYQFGVIELSRQDVSADELANDLPLAWCNPFKSLTGEENPTPAQIEVKTYTENSKAKGPRESQAQSRDRFLLELRAMFEAYTDLKGGERSFERGRRLVSKLMTRTLTDLADTSITNAFAAFGSIGQRADAPGEGTPLTRLLAELQILASIEGPLGVIEDTLSKGIAYLDSRAAIRKQAMVDAAEALEAARPGFLPLGTWVEGPQTTARDEFQTYVRWFQKRSLITDMRDIVTSVRQRYGVWADTLQAAIVATVLPKAEAIPALQHVDRLHLRRLRDRLDRLGQDERALISLKPRGEQREQRDIDMRGFASELRRRATIDNDVSLAAATVASSRWKVTAGPKPAIVLEVMLKGRPTLCSDLRRIHEVLYDSFRPTIDSKLADIDVFDYLLYEQRVHNLPTQELVVRINQAAEMLLEGATVGDCRWAFKNPTGAEKINLIAAINGDLGSINGGGRVHNAIPNHTDRTALTLLKATKLTHGRIADVEACRDEYERLLMSRIGDADDAELHRALTYHPFRGEAEAWFIERLNSHTHSDVFHADQGIPPRLTRLLDRPDFFQAFVQCLATGAIVRNGQTRHWEWRAPGREENPVDLGDGDLIHTAVVFVLQQREAIKGSRFEVKLASALESARRDAQNTAYQTARGVTAMGFHDIVQAFVDPARLETFLTENIPLGQGRQGNDTEQKAYRRLIDGLTMIFRFYGDPDTKTDLSSRAI